MNTTVRDLLDTIRGHFDQFKLPELYSVHVITISDEPRVSAQLAAHHPSQIITDLLTWASTLTHLTLEAWREPSGQAVHLSVTGQLAEEVTIRVYGALPITPHVPGADLAPGASATVPLTVLRHLATPKEVIS
ncbi:MAG TPA: hypothetical protein VN327_06230 [Pseudonocardiaceae bacterium]|jgi:hypothetical protein|nr:hypothetical protein [Pseudonocardiaceae bacterium]